MISRKQIRECVNGWGFYFEKDDPRLSDFKGQRITGKLLVDALHSKKKTGSIPLDDRAALESRLMGGDIVIARQLLKAGANIDPLGNSFPLWRAALTANIPLFDLLIKHGARITQIVIHALNDENFRHKRAKIRKHVEKQYGI